MIWSEYVTELGNTQRKRRMRVLLMAVLILAMLGLGYGVGRHLQGLDQRYVVALESTRLAMEQRLVASERELVNLRLQNDVSLQAGDALREDTKRLWDELAAARDELSFYRSLMAPDKNGKGLQIADFELFRRSAGGYTYHLLLTQVTNQRQRVTGKVEVSFAGRLAGEPQVLALTEISEPAAYPLRYTFRYFQDLKGELRLPEGFEPEQIQVSVNGKGVKDLQRAFVWKDSLAKTSASASLTGG